FLNKKIFLFLCFSHKVFKFFFLEFKVTLQLLDLVVKLVHSLIFMGDLGLKLIDSFISQLDFKFLKFNLLIQGFKFLVVAYVILLRFIFFNKGISMVNYFPLGIDLVVLLFNLSLKLLPS